MNSPKIVCKHIKSNIYFAAAEKSTIEQVFSPIMKQLQCQRGKIERMIIFGKKYSVFIGILKDLWVSALLNQKELLPCLDIGWSVTEGYDSGKFYQGIKLACGNWNNSFWDGY